VKELWDERRELTVGEDSSTPEASPAEALEVLAAQLEAIDRARPFADRVRRIVEYALRIDLAHGKRGMDLHDPLAVGVALDPTLVEWEPVRLAIGPDGQTRRAAGEPNCRFARVVDSPRFLRMFLERLCPAS